jgi:hypothetical protein
MSSETFKLDVRPASARAGRTASAPSVAAAWRDLLRGGSSAGRSSLRLSYSALASLERLSSELSYGLRGLCDPARMRPPVPLPLLAVTWG